MCRRFDSSCFLFWSLKEAFNAEKVQFKVNFRPAYPTLLVDISSEHYLFILKEKPILCAFLFKVVWSFLFSTVSSSSFNVWFPYAMYYTWHFICDAFFHFLMISCVPVGMRHRGSSLLGNTFTINTDFTVTVSQCSSAKANRSSINKTKRFYISKPTKIKLVSFTFLPVGINSFQMSLLWMCPGEGRQTMR